MAAKEFKPDYIIIGAGAGGAVLAARLADDKIKAGIYRFFISSWKKFQGEFFF